MKMMKSKYKIYSTPITIIYALQGVSSVMDGDEELILSASGSHIQAPARIAPAGKLYL